MQTVEIPAKDWSRTLVEFSAVHESALLSLQLLTPALGAQPEIRDMPLVGITAEGGARDSVIIIAAARPSGEHITHIIHAPTHLRIERTNDGVDVALQVESADGIIAILWFKGGSETDR
jgi:Family of unknown function (DUF5335)